MKNIGRPFLFLAAALLTLLPGLSTPALAQFGFEEEKPVEVYAKADRDAARPGDRVLIAVVLDHADGFHSWPSLAHDVLPPEIAEFADRTSIATSVSPSRAAALEAIQWPELHLGKVPDVTGQSQSVEVELYSGQAVAYVPVRVSPDATGSFTVSLTLHYQTCNETSCFRAEDVPFEFVINVDPAAAENPESASHQLFDNYDEAKAVPQIETRPAASFTIFGIQFGGLLLLALVSILGGFVLNLTPCVLPIIPIKIMALSQHAGTPGKTLALGMWMAIGVVAFWAVLGLPVAMVRSFGDPSQLFGYWQVTLGLGLIIAIMGIGIMGLFELKLPKAAYMFNPKADTPWGSFLFGLLTGVLGLPCFGFVAGGLLAGAAVLPATTILIIFVGLGIGMGFPYLILSAYPGLVEKLPRTGPASVLVKQVMGFLLLAAAAFFMATGIKTLISDNPPLADVMHWWAVAFFTAIGSLWLIYRTFQITKSPARRGIFSALGLLLGGSFVGFAVVTTDAAINSVWIKYTPATLAKAMQGDKAVVLDFTADWCITCKALKAGVLDREPVYTRLQGENIAPIKVDLTAKSAPGWKLLKELGHTGIPLLAIYAPGEKTPVWTGNQYTTPEVMKVLDTVAPAPEAIAVTPPRNRGWIAYTPAALAEAIDDGKVVVVDFTSDWSLVNKTLSVTVLDEDPVRSRLKKKDVVAIEANLTSQNAPGWQLLKETGQTGVPLIAVYAPGDTTPAWTANTCTPQQLVKAINDAASMKTADIR